MICIIALLFKGTKCIMAKRSNVPQSFHVHSKIAYRQKDTV